jgi:hypothetical protein
MRRNRQDAKDAKNDAKIRIVYSPQRRRERRGYAEIKMV